jgi:phosphoglycolate phosphatase
MMYLLDYKTIIWDWNGTLLDDAWLGVEIMDSMLKRRNMKGLSIERYRDIFDFPVKDYYAKLGFNFSTEPFEIVGTEFIEKYNVRRFECNLRNSAKHMLAKFKEMGIKQFVLSARNHEQLDEELDFHGIHQYFEHFSGLSDNFANGKLELGMQLIKSQQIDIKKTLMIGDTIHDYEVAQALGIDCVLVQGGHQSVKRLKLSNTMVAKDLEEIAFLLSA